jgi:hypothetical protein
LANAAEHVFQDKLSEVERQDTEAIFVRLVRLGDTGGTTRRISSKVEFSRERWKLIQRLAQEDHQRLLFVGQDTVELAHEALVTQWPRYQTWLQYAASDKRKLDALMDDARRWAEADEATRGDFVLTGYDLQSAAHLLAKHKSWLSENEIGFINASESARTAEEDRRQAAERDKLEVARLRAEVAERATARATVLTRRWAGAATLFLIATLSISLYYNWTVLIPYGPHWRALFPYGELQKFMGDGQEISLSRDKGINANGFRDFYVRVVGDNGTPIRGAKVAWHTPYCGSDSYVAKTNDDGVASASNLCSPMTYEGHEQIAFLTDKNRREGFWNNVQDLRRVGNLVTFNFQFTD